MKKLCWLFLFLLTALFPVHAQNPLLRVATTQFTSPFVMQGHHQLYGFDIAMISYICAAIKRDCQYQLMPFDQLLTSVASNKADIAISGITITTERYELVNFSIPYMLSNTRFLGRSNMANRVIDAKLLSTSRIGTITGKVFDQELLSLGAINPTIVHFNNEPAMIEALTTGSIDFALLDDPTANYWQQTTNGTLVTMGNPIPYGFGLGIAINKKETALVDTINEAIRQFQKSTDFKTNYNTYFGAL